MHLNPDVVIVMGVDKAGTPEFVYIQELVDECNKVVLGVKTAQIVEYDTHFHSWVIQVTTQKHLTRHKHSVKALFELRVILCFPMCM